MRRDPLAKLIRSVHRGTGLRLSPAEVLRLGKDLGIGQDGGPAVLPDEDELRQIAAEQGETPLPRRDDMRGL